MKTYFNPTTETVEIEAFWALCQESPNNSSIIQDHNPRNAPKRQVF
jgi:hypothetical protein